PGEVSGHDERFLVGQSDALAGFERGEGRVQSGGAHDRVEHDVHVISSCGFDETALPGPPARVVSRAVPDQSDERWLEAKRLLLEERRVREGGERGDAKAITLAVEHAKRGRTDRPG